VTATRLETFQQSLASHGVDWTSVEAAAFADELSDLVEEPAVGARLPFAGLSYEDTPVVVDPTPAELADARTGVTAAAFAVADYGSVVLESGAEGTEQVSLYPRTHVAVVRASDVLADMEAAFARLQDRFETGATSAVLATGPSATADMGALVLGAHGPSAVAVVVLEDR